MAANWAPTGQQIGSQPIENTETTQYSALGTIIRAKHVTYGEGTFIYLKGIASTVAGDAVTYDNSAGTTTRWAGTATTGQPLAWAMSANVASQFGWYQIGGVTVCNTSGTVAAGDRAFFQATGVISTTAVAGKQVLNCTAVSANGTPSANKALYQMQTPFSQGQIT